MVTFGLIKVVTFENIKSEKSTTKKTDDGENCAMYRSLEQSETDWKCRSSTVARIINL